MKRSVVWLVAPRRAGTSQSVPAASGWERGEGCAAAGEPACSGEVVLTQVCGPPAPHEPENLLGLVVWLLG